jgi:hypothetical protein
MSYGCPLRGGTAQLKSHFVDVRREPPLDIAYGGRVFRTFHLYRCYGCLGPGGPSP